jgi:hypothetical protein
MSEDRAPAAATTPASRYADAFAVGEFRALAGARLVSMLGDSAAFLAVTVLIYQRTGSALLASLVFAVSFLPYLFGGALLSALVDRVPARRLIVGTDLAAAVLVGVIVVPAVPVLLIFLAMFLIGTMAPVRGGCIDALVAEILPGEAYVAGRSVQRIIAQASQVVGIGMGGLLITPLGPRGALVADTLSFLLSAAILALAVRTRPATGAGAGTGRSVVADSLAGIRQVWSRPAIRRLLLLGWAVPFVAVAPEALAAPSVSAARLAPGYVGLWLMAIPAGMIAGDLIAVWAVPGRWRLRLAWPLAGCIPLLEIAFALRPPFPVQLGLLVASGLAAAYSLGLDQALRDATPVELRGRTFALNSTGLMVVQGAGFATAGLLGELLRPPAAIACAGAAGLVLVLLLPPRSRAHQAAGSAAS